MKIEVFQTRLECPFCNQRVLGLVDQDSICECERCHRSFRVERSEGQFCLTFDAWSQAEADQAASTWAATPFGTDRGYRFRPMLHATGAWTVVCSVSPLCYWACFSESDIELGLSQFVELAVSWRDSA